MNLPVETIQQTVKRLRSPKSSLWSSSRLQRVSPGIFCFPQQRRSHNWMVKQISPKLRRLWFHRHRQHPACPLQQNVRSERRWKWIPVSSAPQRDRFL